MMKSTFIKTCTYSVMHMSVSITISYLLTGSWKIALAIGMVEPCAQIAAYFVHESVWQKILKDKNEPVKEIFPCCSHMKNIID